MANSKISALTSATTPLAGTEVLPVVQSSATVQVSVQNILSSVQPTGTAKGVAYLNASKVMTTGSALVFDGTNLGLAVTPAAWGSGVKVVQVSNYAAVSSSGAYGGAYSSNCYYNNTNWVYITTDNATQYTQVAGQHQWFTAASGTAGTAVTFTQAMTLNASSNLSVVGNIIPSTAAKGINFTANTSAAGMTSKLLNDYEEGTWTPTDGSGAGLTFSTALGWYTKIGKLVTVTCRVVYPTTASAFNAAISGVPFTSQTASLYIPTGILSNGGGTAAAYASIASNVSVIRLFTAANSTAITNVSFSTFTVGFSLSYITA